MPAGLDVESCGQLKQLQTSAFLILLELRSALDPLSSHGCGGSFCINSFAWELHQYFISPVKLSFTLGHSEDTRTNHSPSNCWEGE
jgi:hypothetical protein